jgi:hypothetical protein
MNPPTIEELHSLFELRTDTGDLVRRVTRNNFAKAGGIAGTVGRSGYRSVCINRRGYRAHRIVFAMAHGRWPEGEIDHINGVPDDNRPCNLRECSKLDNCANKKKYANNTSGHPGVRWSQRHKKWIAILKRSGRYITVGRCREFKDAVACRIEAEKRYFGEFARNHHG